MASFVLRPAESRDADAIAGVHTLSRRDALPYLPVLHTDDETRAWVTHVVLVDQDVWVAERQGQVIGITCLHGHELEHLYVLPGEQGQGVGSALLAKAMELSPDELVLWAFQRNVSARAFYEHRGFTAIAWTDGADNEEHEPDVRYRWTPASTPAPDL